MDDRHAQFFLAVADACGAADLADFEVEVVTVTGRRASGVPSQPPRESGSRGELDEIGGWRALLVDDHVIDIDDVRRCTLVAPDGV